MKIYTKTGDRGTTSLFGGRRVGKDSLRIAAYGAVDELNSQLGVALTFELPKDVSKKLLRIQADLFVFGSDLSTPYDARVKTIRIGKSSVTRLEKEIDEWEKGLPSLKNFILPGGCEAGAHLHLARTIARRAERKIVELSAEERINPNALLFINRLSDWLFVLARYVNKIENIQEKIWSGRKNRK